MKYKDEDNTDNTDYTGSIKTQQREDVPTSLNSVVTYRVAIKRTLHNCKVMQKQLVSRTVRVVLEHIYYTSYTYSSLFHHIGSITKRK